MPHPHLISSQKDYLIQVFDRNSQIKWQTVQIQISWLLQKPTDLDFHCLLRQGMSCSAREGLTAMHSDLVPSCLLRLVCLNTYRIYKPLCKRKGSSDFQSFSVHTRPLWLKFLLALPLTWLNNISSGETVGIFAYAITAFSPMAGLIY